MYILAQAFANYLLARVVDLFPHTTTTPLCNYRKNIDFHNQMLNKVFTLVDTLNYSENSGPRGIHQGLQSSKQVFC